MLESLVPSIMQLDIRLLYLLGAIGVLLVAVSIIKAAYKVGVALLVITLLIGVGLPKLQEVVGEGYSVSYDKVEDKLEMKIAGEPYIIPIGEIKETNDYRIVFIEDEGKTSVSLRYKMTDGTMVVEEGKRAVEIPDFAVTELKKFLNKNDIHYEEK